MAKVVPIKSDRVREEDARASFANYVQSVAFNITLSRQMITALGMVRDIGNIADKGKPGEKYESFADYCQKHPMAARSWMDRNSVTYGHALKRRGLVRFIDLPRSPANGLVISNFHDKPYIPHQSYALTRAGELVCDLLVEAGLLAPAMQIKGRRRA